MRELAELLNSMLERGVILNYALFGAIAQMRYTEPVATLDADVLVSLSDSNRLDVLTPIYEFCSAHGYGAEGEAIRIGAWPVQFIPPFDELTAEALEHAETVDFDGVPFRVVGPAHLAVIALKTGRAKDFARILSLLESGAVERDEIEALASLHALDPAWQRFTRKFLDE